jgi:hypothetical protein
MKTIMRWFRQGKTKEEIEFLRERNITNVSLIEWDGRQDLRLQSVMAGDVVGSSHVTTFAVEFASFCQRHPSWRDERCVLFWNSYPSIEMVIRRQLSAGLCFMHAPVVLQHYLVSIKSGTSSSDRKMIDIASYIAQFRNGDALLQIVRDGDGGDSDTFLEEIYRSDPQFEPSRSSINIRSKYWRETVEEISEQLKVRPALVSNFKVDETFSDSDSGTSFLDPDTFNQQLVKGRHAMLLIGSRVEGDQVIFLLQNWWAGRYLIEVSASYLSRCGAVIVDVFESSLTSVPDVFPTIGGLYAETAIDCGETFHEML